MRPLTTLRRSLLSVGLLAAMVAALLAGTPAVAAAASTPFGPRHYYLSLGDSFGFGLQVTRWLAMLDAGTYTPDAFNTGYTDDLAAMIRAQLRPDLQVVNYSCPASGTGEMLRADGCFFHQIGLALHDEFSGSQLEAATAFLRAHPGQVSPITISISTADMLSAVEDCNAAPVCVARSGVFRTIRTNLNVILGRLRAAAPTADIVLLLPHNVTVVDFPGDNPLWAAFVLELRTIAAAHEVRVADAFTAITLSGRTCELTFACLPGILPTRTRMTPAMRSWRGCSTEQLVTPSCSDWGSLLSGYTAAPAGLSIPNVATVIWSAHNAPALTCRNCHTRC